MLYVWLGGAALGLVAGGAVLTDLPLAVKFLVGLAVVAVGVLGPLGSLLLAGLLPAHRQWCGVQHPRAVP